ncbi:MAG: helix-turn-helix domain-containing protein [Gemmatimonadales bacterium]
MPTRFRLRELLEKLGLSQSEAARRSGVSFATVNAMCTNRTAQVSLATLDKIAAALGVEPGDLIVREPKKGKK